MFEESINRRVIASEIVDELRQLKAQMTTQFDRVMGRMVNDTLAVETRTFGTDGVLSRAYRVPAGAIQVTNLSTSYTVTVDAAGALGSVPAQGVGVSVIPAASTRTVALGSHQVTLYGTSGEQVSFQVFAAGVTPAT